MFWVEYWNRRIDFRRFIGMTNIVMISGISKDNVYMVINTLNNNKWLSSDRTISKK
jgi:hypothetical protein